MRCATYSTLTQMEVYLILENPFPFRPRSKLWIRETQTGVKPHTLYVILTWWEGDGEDLPCFCLPQFPFTPSPPPPSPSPSSPPPPSPSLTPHPSPLTLLTPPPPLPPSLPLLCRWQVKDSKTVSLTPIHVAIQATSVSLHSLPSLSAVGDSRSSMSWTLA